MSARDPWAKVQEIGGGLQSFADEMKAKDIHVGIGSRPRCVTCGEDWPCEASTRAVSPEGEDE